MYILAAIRCYAIVAYHVEICLSIALTMLKEASNVLEPLGAMKSKLAVYGNLDNYLIDPF